MEHSALPVRIAPSFGFWRRLIAASVDVLILGAVGLAFTIPFADTLMELGHKGRIIGFVASLFYYGILNSKLGGGATIGKRLLGLRVVRRDGRMISPLRAILRTVVYLLPFYTNGVDFSFLHLPAQQMTVFLVADCAVIFGGGGAIFYLYLANRNTRQSLHDLVCGTFVVRSELVETPIVNRVRSVHLVVVSVWFLIVIAGVSLGSRYLGDFSPLKSIVPEYDTYIELADVALSEPDVGNATAGTNTTVWYVNGKVSRSTSLVITVWTSRTPQNWQVIADGVAKRILAARPDNFGEQNLTVFVKWGYDIGVVTYSNGKSLTYTPAEWRERWKATEKNLKAPTAKP